MQDHQYRHIDVPVAPRVHLGYHERRHDDPRQALISSCKNLANATYAIWTLQVTFLEVSLGASVLKHRCEHACVGSVMLTS